MILKWLNICAKAGISMFFSLLLFTQAFGQQQHRLDTLRLDSIKIFSKSKFFSGLVKKGVDAITKDPADTANRALPGSTRNENPYLQYEGYYIRHIYINRIKFKQFVPDSGKKIEALGAKLANSFHTNTREWVIRNNLFIREGKPLDPYKLADNERYLRTLEFIKDARIVVLPVSDDTADIEVISKDVFTLAGGLDIGSLQHVKGDISESNLLGMGQKVKLTVLWDQNREPTMGYRVLYAKNSIGGSFINGSVGYSTMNGTLFDGREEELSYFASLDRPLVSSNAKFAGGLYYGYRASQDNYAEIRPDSLFYKYSLHSFDGWVGYNLASERLSNHKIRDRRFLSLRYARNEFGQTPYQVKGFDPVFNDMQMVLGQVTFFRQDFYKTSYIYGFGITEDIPHGYNISLIGGWHRQLDLERPYMGIKADRYLVSKQGAFYRIYFRAGAFYKTMQLEDAGILLGANIFSRLVQWRNTKLRQYTVINYAGLFNHNTGDLLHINNPFGLYNFNDGNISGDQRIGFLSETSVFLKYKFLGFKFAPFVSLNATAITPRLGNFSKAEIYTGLGGGIRARNENLVFGTIELRGVYFPRPVEGQPSYKILLNTNLKYRYGSSYVNRPDITRLNVDDGL